MKICSICGGAAGDADPFCACCGNAMPFLPEEAAEPQVPGQLSMTDPFAPAVTSPAAAPVEPSAAQAAFPQNPVAAAQQPRTPYPQQNVYPPYGTYAPRIYPAEQQEPVTTLEWLVNLLLSIIPIVNIVMLFIWALGSSVKPSQRTWARAMLIFLGVLFFLGIFVTLLGVVIDVSLY